jgi:conjugal transfer pilus assembly protein TraE
MKLSAYQAELKKLLDQRNGYLMLSSGLLILTIVLSVLIIFLCGRERIVLITPTMNSDMWVSNKNASSDYLTRTTLYFAELALNVTPDNVDFQQEAILRHADPSYYKVLKPALLNNADKVKKDHISTSFFPVDIKVDVKHNEAIVIGDLKSYVGDTALPTKRISYRISYRLNAFTPLITAFEEVKNA